MMESVIILVLIGFVVGCALGGWWVKKSFSVKKKIEKNRLSGLKAEGFNFPPGVSVERMYESPTIVDHIYVVKNDDFLEIFGAWTHGNRRDPEVDPNSIFINTSKYEELFKFSEFFGELAEEGKAKEEAIRTI